MNQAYKNGGYAYRKWVLRQSGAQDHRGKEGAGKDTKTTETAKKSREKANQ